MKNIVIDIKNLTEVKWQAWQSWRTGEPEVRPEEITQNSAEENTVSMREVMRYGGKINASTYV